MESDEFTTVNEPLRNLKADRKSLCINVCKSGRHRSVGNGTGQQEIVQDQLYGPVSANHTPATRVQLLHLQADSHWDKMCDNTGQICALCNPTIPQNKRNLQRAYDMLKPLIPSQAKLAPKAASTSIPFQSSGMPAGSMNSSIGGTASAKAITPPPSYVPAKAQPAALTRATQAALLPPKAIGAAPRRASSQPVPASGTARTRTQSGSSGRTITPQQLQELHKEPRIVVSKSTETDKDEGTAKSSEQARHS